MSAPLTVELACDKGSGVTTGSSALGCVEIVVELFTKTDPASKTT